jgi:hypothetical protein
MANKHEEMLTILGHKEMQIRTLRFHLTLVKMPIVNNISDNKCWRGCGGEAHFYTVGGDVM